MKNTSHNIALISGGYSSEKIVSKKSAKTVYGALKEGFKNVFWIEVHKEKWVCIYENQEFEINKNDFSVDLPIGKVKFDYAYLIIHGTPAEDGLLAAYFEMLDIPHSSCSPLAAQITFDKAATIRYAKALHIPISPSIEYSLEEYKKLGVPEINLEYPLFVKACRSGSSFGVSKVNDSSELKDALENAYQHDSNCLIEQGIKGTEVTCGVYKSKGIIKTIAITEVVPYNDFFDFDSKYNGDSDEITPARITDQQDALIRELSIKIYDLFNLDGICRIDYMINENSPQLIEINTIPGMTAESFIPQQIDYLEEKLSDFLYNLIQEKLK
jgi:D-alanine-D-alanine ligase